jgi:redox-sensitive bicupin YhaK (pirin superfamily)
VLPRRGRRTVGAWCFADQMGPTDGRGVEVAPHPHIGLQTVTWLLDGEIVHRDSVGSEQSIRPGQLNLMTAGGGVSHSEEAVPGWSGRTHGIQLWVAQPEATRWGAPAFEHHSDLPQVALDHAEATVLVGELAGAASPARRDTDHVGAELRLRSGRTVVPVAAGHEHAVVVLRGAVRLAGASLLEGQLGYVAPGRGELVVEADDDAVAMLLGGIPFTDELVMWWNYVARSRREVIDAHAEWTAGAERFGTVASELAPIHVDPPPWGGS